MSCGVVADETVYFFGLRSIEECFMPRAQLLKADLAISHLLDQEHGRVTQEFLTLSL